jgi:hypothetical protein
VTKNRHVRLKAALEAYEQLTREGRVLTATQARQRAERLQTLRILTNQPDSRRAIKRARVMINGVDPKTQKSRKIRYIGAASLAPRRARPNTFDATRVEQVISTAVEGSRRRHLTRTKVHLF